MNRKHWILNSLVIGAAAFAVSHQVAAQNLLVNGGFEDDGIPGWSLEQTVTGLPGVPVNSAQIQDFANVPEPNVDEAGLWLRAFAGNVGVYFHGRNALTNARLTQLVPGTAGEVYTLTGWSRFEEYYSGGVDILDPFSPSGAIPSLTETVFELSFLDASGNAIDSPVTLDIRADREAQIGFPFANDNSWRQHTLVGIAPAGTSQIVVTAAATDMAFNSDISITVRQSAFFDDFSLVAGSAPATELLANGNLNAPSFVPGWTVTEAPEGADTLELIEFAHNPISGGSVGVWLKPFGAFPDGDAILTQTVAAVAGRSYTFSGWSAFEPFYSGAEPVPTTVTFLELAFLDAQHQLIGTPISVDVASAGQTPAAGPIGDHPEAWRQFSVDGVAPPGTAYARVRAGAVGMYPGADNPQSAFFDDFSFTSNIPEPHSLLLVAIGPIVGACRPRLWRRPHSGPREAS